MPKATKHQASARPDPVYEADAGDACRALRAGDVDVLRRYIEELESNLRVIAELLAPTEGHAQRLVFDTPGAPEVSTESPDANGAPDAEEREWDDSTRELRVAISLGVPGPIGWYLRDAADLLRLLRRVLDTDRSEKSEWHLRFQRRRRGKPADVATRRKHGLIVQHVRLMELRGWKREAAVADACWKYEVDRSTVMRALASASKKPSKSHEKRE